MFVLFTHEYGDSSNNNSFEVFPASCRGCSLFPDSLSLYHIVFSKCDEQLASTFLFHLCEVLAWCRHTSVLSSRTRIMLYYKKHVYRILV
jgi:hypothetical protein